MLGNHLLQIQLFGGVALVGGIDVIALNYQESAEIDKLFNPNGNGLIVVLMYASGQGGT